MNVNELVSCHTSSPRTRRRNDIAFPTLSLLFLCFSCFPILTLLSFSNYISFFSISNNDIHEQPLQHLVSIILRMPIVCEMGQMLKLRVTTQPTTQPQHGCAQRDGDHNLWQ